MGMYKYTNETWNRREKNGFEQYLRQLSVRWRREPTVHRVEHPTRLERARALGYRAKQGYVVVRVRIRKGGARKIRPRAGRRQKASGVTKFTPLHEFEEHCRAKGEEAIPEPPSP